MPRFVVLLRGVNVGKGNRVPMAELRALLEGRGFGAVRTLLNSGNVVVDAPGRSAAAHAKTVHGAIEDEFGLDVAVVVKSKAEFLAAVDEVPADLPAAEHSRVLLAFAQKASTIQALSALEPLIEKPERLVMGEHAARFHLPDGIHTSKAGKAMLGKPGRGVTSRNLATVLKLKALVETDGA
jgi:uncharacterized protein (DUF1697 family)